MSVETILLFVLAAVAVIVVVHWLAERTGLPAAALLTLVGHRLRAAARARTSPLDPHLVLTVVLPPLLYSAALDSSLLAIRRNLRTVVSLSVLLVLVTAVLIGVGLLAVRRRRDAGRRASRSAPPSPRPTRWPRSRWAGGSACRRG